MNFFIAETLRLEVSEPSVELVPLFMLEDVQQNVQPFNGLPEQLLDTEPD